MAIVALLDVVLGEVFGLTFGANIFGAVAAVFIAFYFFVFWVHAHVVILLTSSKALIGRLAFDFSGSEAGGGAQVR